MYLSFFNLAYCLYLCSAAATLTALLFQDGRRNSFYFSSVSVMLLLFVFVCMHRVYICLCVPCILLLLQSKVNTCKSYANNAEKCYWNQTKTWKKKPITIKFSFLTTPGSDDTSPHAIVCLCVFAHVSSLPLLCICYGIHRFLHWRNTTSRFPFRFLSPCTQLHL